ncbi:hypothetical protein ACJX0J_037931, partial [Zea mays]
MQVNLDGPREDLLHNYNINKWGGIGTIQGGGLQGSAQQQIYGTPLPRTTDIVSTNGCLVIYEFSDSFIKNSTFFSIYSQICVGDTASSLEGFLSHISDTTFSLEGIFLATTE